MFEGEWIDDEMHDGVFTWANGDEYDGTYLNGKEHGKGTLKNDEDGTTYIGEFFEGKK